MEDDGDELAYCRAALSKILREADDESDWHAVRDWAIDALEYPGRADTPKADTRARCRRLLDLLYDAAGLDEAETFLAEAVRFYAEPRPAALAHSLPED